MTNDSLQELLQAQHTIADLYQTNRRLSDEVAQLQLRLTHRLATEEAIDHSVLDTASEAEISAHLADTQKASKRSRFAILRALLLSREIRRLRLFDFNWYINRYPDVAASGVRPFKHFLMYGVFEGRDPSPRFNTRRYIARYLHLLNPGEPPLFHYLAKGRASGLCAAQESPAERQTRALATAMNSRIDNIDDAINYLRSEFDKQFTNIERLAKNMNNGTAHQDAKHQSK